MITVKDTKIERFKRTEDLQKIPGVENSVVYQKSTAVSQIPMDLQSDELIALGGLNAVAGSSATATDNFYLVHTPIVVLDDRSFMDYCEQIDVEPQLDGAIIINRIWDSRNSTFRYKEYVPYIKEQQHVINIQDNVQTENIIEIPVLAYTEVVPILREEYDNYALVQVIPQSLWKGVSEQIGNTEPDTYIRVLAEEGISLAQLNALETTIAEKVSPDYVIETENRLQERVTNNEMLKGYKMMIGAFCVMLAAIGIANIFSNTLGYLYQRKREFAQYMSIGMTPANIRKLFCIEALVIAGRPLLVTLPLTVVFVGFMITASYLDPMEFISVAPYLPVTLFIVAIFVFVGFAYYLGGKKVLKHSLADSLRNDTLT